MHLQTLIVVLLVLVSAICVITTYAEDVDRRDIHRIVLKPEKSKKHKKRTKAPKVKPTRPQRPPPSSYEDGDYEPSAQESITRYRTHRERPHYSNHHDEYHDLVNPKPPRHEDPTPYNPPNSYPEEETSHYDGVASGASQQNYVPYLQNSGGQLNTNVDTQADVFVDWNPIPSTQLTHDYRHGYDQHAAATATGGGGTKPAKRTKRKKTRRVTTTTTTTARSPVIFMTSTPTYRPFPRVSFTTLTPTVKTTTAPPVRPLTLYDSFNPVQPKLKTLLNQEHHFVNYNHNNQSVVNYEVGGSARKPTRYTQTQTHITPQHQSAPSIPQPVYVHNRNQALDNSYEIIENGKDYNKQIKQTSGFKGTLVPQPIYPQLQPFLPTVSTYAINHNHNHNHKTTKPSFKPSTLEFGKKTVGAPFTPNPNFSKLYLGLN